MTARARAGAPGRIGLGPVLSGGLLVVVGFAVGLVAGAVFEDPALVLGSLAGRDTAVPLQAAAEPSQTPVPSQVASPSKPERAAEPARDVAAAPPVVRRAEAPRAAPAAPSAPAPPAPREVAGGEFAIQVGAFGDAETAERLAATLRRLGLPVYVASGEQSDRVRYRVRVGPLATQEAAVRLATRLKGEHRLPTWVLREDAP